MAPHLWKGTRQTAHGSYISFIVIWPGFDSIARLIPATLQRDMVYDEQAPLSCSFDRHFLEYTSAVQNGDSGRQGCIHCMHYSHYMHYSHFITYINYTKCIHYFAGSSSKGTVVKKISMLNKNPVNLIDEFSGLWDSRQRHRQRRLYQLHIIHLLFSNISIISLVLILS